MAIEALIGSVGHDAPYTVVINSVSAGLSQRSTVANVIRLLGCLRPCSYTSQGAESREIPLGAIFICLNVN